MPLVELWKKTPETVLRMSIKQVVSNAGDGTLIDGSECSQELRHFFKSAPEEKLYEHVRFCLESDSKLSL